MKRVEPRAAIIMPKLGGVLPNYVWEEIWDDVWEDWEVIWEEVWEDFNFFRLWAKW